MKLDEIERMKLQSNIPEETKKYFVQDAFS